MPDIPLTLDVYPNLSPSRRPGPAKVAPDVYSAPLGDESPIWTVYAEAANTADKALVDEWNRGLDTLALFSGLFSAVTSAFIIESYKLMQPDYTELTFKVLLTNFSGASYVEEDPFPIPQTARAVNALWLTSLALSLSAALVSIMGKDWIAAYRVPDMPNIREWAQLRQFRCDSTRRWYMAEIIAFAPLLLHLSLLLFASGLAVFLFPVDTVTSSLVVGLSALAATFYAIIVCSPFISSSSPFRSPSTSAMRAVVQTFLSWFVKNNHSPYDFLSWMTVQPLHLIRYIRHCGSILIRSRVSMERSGTGQVSLHIRPDLSWGRLYNRAVTSMVAIWTKFVLSSRKLRSFFTRSEIDMWHEPSDSAAAFQRTAAAVIAWIAESSPTPDTFRAVVHVLKDAEKGTGIASLASPGVKRWFSSGASLFSPLGSSLTDASRIIVAANHLTNCQPDLLLDRLFRERIYHIYDHPPSTWPEDLLLHMLYSRMFDVSICRQLSVHASTLSLVLDVIDLRWHDGRVNLSLHIFDQFKAQFTGNTTLLGKMVRALQASELEHTAPSWLKRAKRSSLSQAEVHECQDTGEACRLIELLCYHLRIQNTERYAVIQTALSALIHLCSHHSHQSGHSSIAQLFGNAHRTDVLWTARIWTQNDVGAMIRCIPWSGLSRQIASDSGEVDAENELDDNIVRTLTEFLSLDLLQNSGPYAATGSMESCYLLSSLIPPAPLQVLIDELDHRVLTSLRTVLNDVSLQKMRKDGLWAFAALIADIASFLARQTNPNQSEVVALFVQLIGSSTHDPGRWSLAEAMPDVIRGSNDDILRRPLQALVLLRSVYPQDPGWLAIARNVHNFIHSAPPPWLVKYTAMIEEFCIDLGFQPPAPDPRPLNI